MLSTNTVPSSTFTMPRRLERVLTAWDDPVLGDRPPTPHPAFESRSVRRSGPRDQRDNAFGPGPRSFYRYVEVTYHDRDKSTQSRIDAQNAKIAARPAPRRHPEQRPSGPKRVRFVLPKRRSDREERRSDREERRSDREERRSDREERDVLAWELAKLGIRDPLPGSDRRRCSRCGQTLRRRGRAEV